MARERIGVNSEIYIGRPCTRGTRIAVKNVVGTFAGRTRSSAS